MWVSHTLYKSPMAKKCTPNENWFWGKFKGCLSFWISLKKGNQTKGHSKNMLIRWASIIKTSNLQIYAKYKNSFWNINMEWIGGQKQPKSYQPSIWMTPNEKHVLWGEEIVLILLREWRAINHKFIKMYDKAWTTGSGRKSCLKIFQNAIFFKISKIPSAG